MLHNLLIQDPGAHYLRLCDGMYPVPGPHPKTWDDDARVEATRQYTTNLYALRPELKKVHYIAEDYGLTHIRIREALKHYTDRFSVPYEKEL